MSHAHSALTRARARAPPGNIAVAVFVTAAFCALLAGVLGDALPRRQLLTFFALLSEAACLGTAWVRTYGQLLALRAVAGVALGCVPPLVYSVLADIFPSTRRNLAASFVTVATSAGILTGQIIAGYVGAAHGWRRPFIIVSVPCLFLAALLPVVTREPQRGGAEPTLRLRFAAAAAAAAAAEAGRAGPGAANGAAAAAADAAPAGPDDRTHADADAPPPPPPTPTPTPPPPPPSGAPEVAYDERLDLRKLAAVLAVPTNVVIFAQCIPSYIPWGVLNAFIADYIAQDRGMRVAGATSALLVYAAGGLLGALGGATLTQRLFNRRPTLVGLVVAASTAGGIGPMLYIVRGAYSATRFSPLAGAAFGAGVLTCVAAPALRAAVLNVNPPETRSSAFAIYIFLDSLGKGLGPLGAATLIVKYGRRSAFTTCISLWAIPAALQALLAFTLPRDEATVQARLARAKLSGVGEAGDAAAAAEAEAWAAAWGRDRAAAAAGAAAAAAAAPARRESAAQLLPAGAGAGAGAARESEGTARAA